MFSKVTVPIAVGGAILWLLAPVLPLLILAGNEALFSILANDPHERRIIAVIVNIVFGIIVLSLFFFTEKQYRQVVMALLSLFFTVPTMSLLSVSLGLEGFIEGWKILAGAIFYLLPFALLLVLGLFNEQKEDYASLLQLRQGNK